MGIMGNSGFYTAQEWENHLSEFQLNMRNECIKELYELRNFRPNYVLILPDNWNYNENFAKSHRWLGKNCKGGTYWSHAYQIEFELEDDAMLFRLVWG